VTPWLQMLTFWLPEPAEYVSVRGVLPVGADVLSGLVVEEVEDTGTELSMVPCNPSMTGGSKRCVCLSWCPGTG
jgi:hypothetical protein